MSTQNNLSIKEFAIQTKETNIANVLTKLIQLGVKPKFIFTDCVVFAALADYTLFIVLLVKADILPLDFPTPTCDVTQNLSVFDKPNSHVSEDVDSQKNEFSYYFWLKK